MEHPLVIQALIYYGADVNARDQAGNSPLDTAVQKRAEKDGDKEKYVGIAQLLLQSGARVNDQDSNGLTALQKAMPFGSAEMVHCLLNNNANPTLLLPDGSTIMHIAAGYSNVEAVNALLSRDDCRGMIHVKDAQGNTPLHHAVTGNNWASTIGRKQYMIRTLQEAGADMDAQNNTGDTALHAAAHNNINLGGFLCNAGVDPKKTNFSGLRADECHVSAGSEGRQNSFSSSRW